MTKIAEQFMARFKGLMRAHGIYPQPGEPDAKGKRVAIQVRTIKDKITIRKWDEHLNGKDGLGVVPVNDDGDCWFGAIDIDVYDLNLENLEKRVREAKLPLVVCRTKSGGAHLYLFINGVTDAGLVRDKLSEWAILIGYPKVEIFPKQSALASEDDCGSWINMPYYGGNKTVRYAIKNGNALSVKDFLKYANEIAVTGGELKKIEGKQDPLLDGGPPCLQHLARAGFPEGTRNMALYNLGIFCKFKYGDVWKDKTRDMNKKYLIPPLSDAEVTIILKQLAKKDYFYRCKEPPIADSCNKAICAKREYGISNSQNDPGIILDGLTKVKTEPPTWYMNVNGKRIKLDSSEDLLSQKKFERVCVDSHNIIPTRIKESAWRDVLRELMTKIEEIEAPADAGPFGQFIYLLEKFCVELYTDGGPEEILLGKVYFNLKEDKMYFQSPYLLAFLERFKFRITSKQAWTFMRELKGADCRFRVAGQQFRAWSLPAFKIQKIDFDKPKLVKDGGEDLF